MNKERIIGSRIAQVHYSEVNDQQGRSYFDGFDTIDCGVHIRLSNGYAWNFPWTDDEIFELDEGIDGTPEFLELNGVKTWDATDRW